MEILATLVIMCVTLPVVGTLQLAVLACLAEAGSWAYCLVRHRPYRNEYGWGLTIGGAGLTAIFIPWYIWAVWFS